MLRRTIKEVYRYSDSQQSKSVEHPYRETPETCRPKRRDNKNMAPECRLYSKISFIYNGFHTKGSRESIHANRNIEARSRNHCCRGNSISSTHSECVSLPLAS